MSKVLVVYGTGTGCTTGVAERIGEALGKQSIDTEITSAENAPAPTDFDAVIVGSGVRAGQWHQPVRSWVETNAGSLKSKPLAFYTVGLTMTSNPEKADEVRAYTDPLIEQTGVKPVDVGLFAGCNDPKKFSFVERSMLTLMKAPVGDFRDWDAIDAWTDRVAKDLGLGG